MFAAELGVVPIAVTAPSSCNTAPSAISFQRWRSSASVITARLRIRMRAFWPP
jgi:hypothetical protein